MRTCPKTSKECEHPAGCNMIEACNMPIPIKEFASQSPENKAQVDKFFEGIKNGTIVLS